MYEISEFSVRIINLKTNTTTLVADHLKTIS